MTLCLCMCVCTQSSLWRLNLERHDDVLLRTSTPSCIKIPSTANHCTYLLRLTHGVLVCNFPLFALFFALSGWAIFVTLLLGIVRQASGNVCEPPWIVIAWEDLLATVRLERGSRCSCLRCDIASVNPVQQPLKYHVSIWLRVQALGQRTKPQRNRALV